MARTLVKTIDIDQLDSDILTNANGINDINVNHIAQFALLNGTPGYAKLPNGFTIQWGQINMNYNQSFNTVNYQLTFSTVRSFQATLNIGAAVSGSIGTHCRNVGNASAQIMADQSNDTSSGTAYWIAIGII
jgi:surface antigen